MGLSAADQKAFDEGRFGEITPEGHQFLSAPKGLSLEDQRAFDEGRFGEITPAGHHFLSNAPQPQTFTPPPPQREDGVIDGLLKINPAWGAVEPIAQVASGLGASVLGNLGAINTVATGIADSVTGFNVYEDKDPEEVRRRIQEKFTYQPRTEIGQSPYHPVNVAMKALGAVGAGVDSVVKLGTDPLRGDPTQYAPYRQGAANFVEAAAPEALGYIGAKYGAPLTKRVVDNVTEQVMGRHFVNARKIIDDSLGQDSFARRRIGEAVRQGNPGNLTTAQAAVHEGLDPSFAALERLAASNPTAGANLNSARVLQSNQMTKELQKMAGGISIEDALRAQKGAKVAANSILEPVAKNALSQADDFTKVHQAAKIKLDNAKANLAMKGSSTPMSERVAAVKAAQKELDSLPRLTPLTPDAVFAKMDDITGQFSPGIRPHIEKVSNNLLANIKKAADANGGVLRADDIRQLRKSAVNDAIEVSLKGVDTTVKSDIVRAMSDLKPTLDNMIENAGGTGWKGYNAAYSARMREISRMKVAEAALRKLKAGDKKGVADVGRGDAPEVLESAFGTGNFELSRTGTDAANYKLMTEYLDNETMLSSLADQGNPAIRQIIKNNRMVGKFPNPLDPAIAIINKLKGAGDVVINQKTLEEAAKAMQSPQNYVELMARKPITADTLRFLNNPNLPAASVLIGQGMMSAEQEEYPPTRIPITYK